MDHSLQNEMDGNEIFVPETPNEVDFTDSNHGGDYPALICR
jgi:hypothetical protein